MIDLAMWEAEGVSGSLARSTGALESPRRVSSAMRTTGSTMLASTKWSVPSVAIPPFAPETLRAICDVLGDPGSALTGTQIGRVLAQCGL